MSLHNFLLFHLRRHVKNSGFVLHHGFQTPRNRWKHSACGLVLSSVSRCLEPVMKHSPSFLTYYIITLTLGCNFASCNHKKGFSQDIAPVSNIRPQCAELSILDVTFQQNCKYSSHVRGKVTKANKSLFVLGFLRMEGMSQEEVDHLFNAIVLPNFSYALPVYGASDSDPSVIQNFLDRCMKRKFMSKNVNIRDLLEKADKTLYKKRSNDPECPFFQFLPKEKNTRYNLRDTPVSVPRIYTDRFKNVLVTE